MSQNEKDAIGMTIVGIISIVLGVVLLIFTLKAEMSEYALIMGIPLFLMEFSMIVYGVSLFSMVADMGNSKD